jgi:hypothetical protein
MAFFVLIPGEMIIISRTEAGSNAFFLLTHDPQPKKPGLSLVGNQILFYESLRRTMYA